MSEKINRQALLEFHRTSVLFLGGFLQEAKIESEQGYDLWRDRLFHDCSVRLAMVIIATEALLET